MKLLRSPNLTHNLNGVHLLLDTTSIINASKSNEFLALLTKLSHGGCDLVTIPSVVYEFSRGARTMAEYNEYLQFIAALKLTVLNSIEASFDAQMRVFLVAYHKAFSGKSDKKAPSYTDSLLCMMAYKYRTSGMLLMTANHRDIPESMFERTELITIDVKGELRNEAIYRLTESRFKNLLSGL